MTDDSAGHFAAIHASASDLRKSADRALERAGLTEAELREQAVNSDFESLHARLAWISVSALEPPAQEPETANPTEPGAE